MLVFARGDLFMNRPTTPKKRYTNSSRNKVLLSCHMKGAQWFLTPAVYRRSCRSTAFAFAPSTWAATKQPDVFGRLAGGFKVEKNSGSRDLSCWMKVILERIYSKLRT